MIKWFREIIRPVVRTNLLGGGEMKKQGTALSIQRVSINGGLIVCYIERGSGPALVLLPGLFQNVSGLRHLIVGLSRRFRVICPAVPGSDGSSLLPHYNLETIKWWLEKALSALAVRTAIFVTVSMGAVLAVPVIVDSDIITVQAYVAHEPVTRVRDAGFLWRTLYHLDCLLRKVRLGWLSLLGLWLLRGGLARLSRFFPIFRFARALQKTPLCSLARLADFMSNAPMAELTVRASEKVPTMVVMGTRQTRLFLHYGSINQVVERMLSAVRSILHGAGHFLRQTDQEKLAEEIIQFAVERGILPPE
jgi:pimeloyl-ACP methyl ester carboxylesterase